MGQKCISKMLIFDRYMILLSEGSRLYVSASKLDLFLQQKGFAISVSAGCRLVRKGSHGGLAFFSGSLSGSLGNFQNSDEFDIKAHELCLLHIDVFFI